MDTGDASEWAAGYANPSCTGKKKESEREVWLAGWHHKKGRAMIKPH